MVTSISRERGFALVEVLVAIVVTTVLAVGILAGERGADAALRRSLDESCAVWAATAALEDARAHGADLAIGARTTTVDGLPGATVETRCDLVEPGLVAVRATVRWTVGPRTREHTLTTWIAREEGR